MATDPIRGVRERAHDTALDLDARAALTRLAALPPSADAPYLTVSLDWRPDGTDPGRSPSPDPRPSERRSGRDDGPQGGASRRPSRQQFERELAAVIAEHGPRGAAFDSLTADAGRIATYLDDELDPVAQGVVIVACAAAAVFEPLALGLPVSTRLAVGPTPALTVLARLVDDHPTYAVLLADQHDAILSVIAQATREQSVSVESTDYPRKQQQGGWSQRRFQARAGERVAAFARGIADETQRALDEAGVDMLILAGDEIITSALDAAFHQSVKDRIVGTLRLDIGASEQDLIGATLPLVEQAEREREGVAVAALRDGLGAGGPAVSGAEATLAALQSGQVATLLMTDDFDGDGWADYALPVYGVGDVPAQHPLGGDGTNIVAVALEEELIRLAVQIGADVQIVATAGPVDAADLERIPKAGDAPPRAAPAAALDELGGVGALLRFTLAEQTGTG